MDLSILCLGDPLPMSPGIYFDMPREEYDRIPAFSQTVLKVWLEHRRNPGRFKTWLDNRVTEPKSDSLIKGSALDCLLLEPHRFSEKFVILPETLNRRTNEGKAAYAAIVAANPGKEILRAKMADEVSGMAAALRCDPEIAAVLANCRKAVIITELEGFPVKLEIDLFTEQTEHLFDLKTAQDIGDIAFAIDAIEYGYDKQWTFYLRAAQAVGLDKRIFNFITVRNTDPHDCFIHSVRPADTEAHGVLTDGAWAQLKSAMSELSARIESRDWPLVENYTPLSFPAWAVTRARRVLEAAA